MTKFRTPVVPSKARDLQFHPGFLVAQLLGVTTVEVVRNPRRSKLRLYNFLTCPRRVKTLEQMSPTQSEFRKAMGCFATGVTVITVDFEGAVHGMTANAFASVSLDPLLVLVCVDNRARTHAHLHARKRFGVNVLAEDQQPVSEFYARPAAAQTTAEPGPARFERTPHSTPVLQGALAYLECRLHTTQDAGDHTIFIAEVEDVVVRDGNPLLFFRGKYRRIGP